VQLLLHMQQKIALPLDENCLDAPKLVTLGHATPRIRPRRIETAPRRASVFRRGSTADCGSGHAAGIVAGLERLVQLVDQTPLLPAAERRGYFTPRRRPRPPGAPGLRNYRLAAYEIIFRYREYGQTADENLRLRSSSCSRPLSRFTRLAQDHQLASIGACCGPSS